MLLRFVERVVKAQLADQYLFGKCMFDNTDVTLLIDALQESLLAKPSVAQMHIYHLIAVIYNQRD